MAFGWVIRHQKKALFILAVVLIVGWGLTGTGLLSSWLGGRSGMRAGTAVGEVAGEKVTMIQFQNFKSSWVRVFPDLFSREGIEARYPGQKVSVDDVVWTYLGLLKMARQAGMDVPDKLIVDIKKNMYRQGVGPAAGADVKLDDAADRWFREKMGMTGQQLDGVLYERVMAEKMLNYILSGLEPTREEAWEQYSRENRAVRVKYIAFTAGDFLPKVAQPSEERIKEYYEANKGFGRSYFNQPVVQIEHVQLMLSRLEPSVKVSSEEMEKYYNENKDLYKLKDAKEAQPAEYLLFPEVKAQIETLLRRRAVNEKAAKLLENLRAAWASAQGKSLEALVKEANDPALEYRREPFLNEVQLLELPGIGLAHAEGKNLATLAFEVDAAKPELSPVMSSAEGRFVFRPVAPPREPTVPDLAEVKDRVVADIRKGEAFKLALQAAEAFDNDVIKAGGAAKFDELAADRKLPVKETPFFVNNLYDANRPEFIDRSSALDLGALYGPLSWAPDGVAAVVKVVEERAADRAGFPSEEKIRRDYVLAVKANEVRRAIMPKTVLAFAGYRNLVPREETPATENETIAPPDNATAPPDNQTRPAPEGGP